MMQTMNTINPAPPKLTLLIWPF